MFLFFSLVAPVVVVLLLETILDVLLSLSLGLFAVDKVQSLGLDLTVNKGARKAGKQLLGQGVGRRGT